MKAVEFYRYGPPEVLTVTEKPKPVPGVGEILVRVYSSAVNSGDWRIRKADPFLVRLMFGLTGPRSAARVPGSVFSGIVEAAGEGVTEFLPGDRVFGMSPTAMGCYAEYIVLPENAPVAKGIESLTHEEAACVPFGLHTAYHFMKSIGFSKGDRLLVTGASGSVGTAAVQLGKFYGCHVTAVTNPARLDLLKSLGADTVMDYTKENFQDTKESFDAVIDTAGILPVNQLRKPLKKGGHLILVSGMIKAMLFSPLWSAFWKIRVSAGPAQVSQEDMNFFKNLILEGKYRPVLDRVYQAEDAAEAHRYAEKGHKAGNIALRFSQQT